jgi:hypothetical protein
MAGKYPIIDDFPAQNTALACYRHIFFTNFGKENSIKLILFNPKLCLMNYPVLSSINRTLITFIVRLTLILLLVFFIFFFVVEMFSFISLFEVTVVANPAMNLIK